MRRFNWKTKTLSIAVVLLLILVLNPEVRAILLVIDYLGVDLVLLLLSGYVSRYWSVIAYYAHAALAFIGVRATHILKRLRWIGYGLHPREAQWAHVDHLGLVGGVVIRLALARFR
jgi:hypothetical protein